MEVGTIVEILEPGKGCLGARFRAGTVTDKKANHGLLSDQPGYNVDIGGGQIWRINENARVKIRYIPCTIRKEGK